METLMKLDIGIKLCRAYKIYVPHEVKLLMFESMNFLGRFQNIEKI